MSDRFEESADRTLPAALSRARHRRQRVALISMCSLAVVLITGAGVVTSASGVLSSKPSPSRSDVGTARPSYSAPVSSPASSGLRSSGSATSGGARSTPDGGTGQPVQPGTGGTGGTGGVGGASPSAGPSSSAATTRTWLLVGPDGSPVSGVNVYPPNTASPMTRSDAQGRVSLPCSYPAPGDQLVLGGYASLTGSPPMNWTASADVAQTTATVAGRCGSTTTVRLGAGADLAVHVVGTAGPIASGALQIAPLCLSGSGHYRCPVGIGGAATYLIKGLAAGSYDLGWSSPATADPTVTANGQAVAGQVTDVTLTVPSPAAPASNSPPTGN